MKRIARSRTQIESDITRLQDQIMALETEKGTLSEKMADKLAVIEEQYKASIAKYDAEVESYAQYRDMEPKTTAELEEKAAVVEEMKSHVNEFRRMQSLQADIESMKKDSELLTQRIEKARTLPGEILEQATIPIAGLTVKDGVPLINGLPVSNLSDGEKLDLCIDVAIQNPKGLQIILIDGVEKLSSKWKNRIYQKCKEKGLQFIATRTTDEDEFEVTTL